MPNLGVPPAVSMLSWNRFGHWKIGELELAVEIQEKPNQLFLKTKPKSTHKHWSAQYGNLETSLLTICKIVGR